MLGEALFDLTRLFAGVHVQDELLLLGVTCDRLKPVRRAGADGVGGNAHRQATRAQVVHLTEVLLDRGLAETIASSKPR